MPEKSALVIRVAERDDIVSALSLARILVETVEVLQGIDESIAQSARPTMRWGVAAQSRKSPYTFELVGAPTNGAHPTPRPVVGAFVRGIRALDKSDEVPPHFTLETARVAKRLVGVLNNDVGRIAFEADGEEAVATQHIAANVDAIVDRLRRKYAEWTTLEGRLEGADLHGKREFYLYEHLAGAKVKCLLPENLVDNACASLRKRVAVYGQATYDTMLDRPFEIRAESIDPLRDRGELPQLDDLHGIRITDEDESSEAFVRRLRDGDDDGDE
ncbi:MAG TPA: hypothetical protein VFY71_07745 [Planctomycetota bacterium]|nr:hypothetical protein [Planctomycetota bacterium]